MVTAKPLTTEKPDHPAPMLCCQIFRGGWVDQLGLSCILSTAASRLGPRNCGKSSGVVVTRSAVVFAAMGCCRSSSGAFFHRNVKRGIRFPVTSSMRNTRKQIKIQPRPSSQVVSREDFEKPLKKRYQTSKVIVAAKLMIKVRIFACARSRRGSNH